jgi:hypothetical protein
MEMTVYSSVTGVLTLFWDNLEGQVYFRDGQPYHVNCGDITGATAAALLFEQTQARFSFVSDVIVDKKTIWGDPFEFVDSAERQATRWRRIRRLVPNTSMLPRPLVSAEVAQSRVSPEHWPIFNAIDGRHTLADLARLLRWEELDVAEAVAQMMSDNVLSLDAAPWTMPQAGAISTVLSRNNPSSLKARLMQATPAPAGTTPSVVAEGPSRGSEHPLPLPPAEEAVLRVLRG